MIKIKNKTFRDFLEVYTYMIQTQDESYLKYFPHSRYIFIRFLLEEKFNKKYTVKELKELLKDIPLRTAAEEASLMVLKSLKEKLITVKPSDSN